ncbi:peptidase M61 domain protein [Emticicia oligotrophica DSM 17448]|uniref:Peptidase M61 domain protein n=1 Tax=Emticicia oligotrophica (strain DSM 17448 / CIP 109782 / MTCC 6937 / GPTSA100-15) TaxID=929562 RepID=A0ABM5N3W5_EMTOG|nr:M61 family metallopeptidase [Emticicia oligotrophica]AFK04081.1 peptidase M61 domain protein [Emticicia oligotrophica DSM 17448]
MNYKIYSKNKSSHFIDVEFQVQNVENETLELQLPAWRPGRYELQNFAKNIQKFEVFDAEGKLLPAQKISKDRWKVQTNGAKEITAKYNYYANLVNAGSSYVDENILYVNPVNICVYAEGFINEPCKLELFLLENQVIAGLNNIQKITKGNAEINFNDFYHLADSPFIVSANLKHATYEVDAVKFNLWFEGNLSRAYLGKISTDFKKFTEEQIKLFGVFPEKEYHFITWILPIAYYHGVEHRSSTMQVLGPDGQDFNGSLSDELYIDLLGLASHELFHTWNICKLRPVELLPYDYTKENYFPTCFVAEGVTTYYGDLMLYRSGVFDEKQYLKELETYYKRHFDHSDRASQSLIESSWDLWLDGYTQSIPDRKVSVYHKGAIAAQILDLHLQRTSGGSRSIDDVMRILWQRFGASENGTPLRGYSMQDYFDICEEVAGESLTWYFEQCILGTESLFELLNSYLTHINLRLIRNEENLVQLIKYQS